MKAGLLLLLLAISCSAIAAEGQSKKKTDPRKKELTNQLAGQLKLCKEAVMNKAIGGRESDRAFNHIVDDYYPDSIRAAVWALNGTTASDVKRIEYAIKTVSEFPTLHPFYGATYAVLRGLQSGGRIVLIYRCEWDSKNPNTIVDVKNTDYRSL